MARKLTEAERQRFTEDFDSPAAEEAHDGKAPLKGGKRVRVTASLTQEQYEKLKKLAKKSGQPMSRVLGAAVDALYKH